MSLDKCLVYFRLQNQAVLEAHEYESREEYYLISTSQTKAS